MKRGQTSSPSIIPFFIEAIRTIQPFPDTLIDIGCGAGMYGLMFKWYNRNKETDVFGFNLTDTVDLKYYYDKLYSCNIEIRIDFIIDFIKSNSDSQSVISLIEVVEHLDKDKAINLLLRLSKLNVPIIITTPTHIYQSNTVKKPGYAHKCFFEKDELINLLKPYFKNVRTQIIKDTIYRTEHQCYIFEHNDSKPIPEGIREK